MPRIFLVLACLSAGAFAAVHLAGWRVDTAFLSGNAVTVGAATRGAVYVALWLQAVVLAPTLALAAALSAAFARFGRRDVTA